MKKDFQKLIKTLQESIITWDYFSDFDKAYKNSFKLKVQLNILNSLLGESDLKNKFLEIVEKYSEVRESLLILIATRKIKIKDLSIINPNTLLKKNEGRLFDKSELLTEEMKDELWDFFIESGLKSIFEDKKIKNLEDYVFGVEVGLDSNARKNRTGDIMENLVEGFVSDFCNKNNFKYLRQATKSKIYENFGIKIKMQDSVKNKNGERKFDFAIFDDIKKNIIIIETNYYTSTGSKPSSIAREYIDLGNILKKENVKFVWATDGYGWRKMKNPLEKSVNEMDYVINLNMLKNGVLEEIVNE